MKFTPEQLTKAKEAKSTEDLLILAKENNIVLTEEEAEKYYAELHKEGALADEELKNVSGGSSCTPEYYYVEWRWDPDDLDCGSFWSSSSSSKKCGHCDHYHAQDSNTGLCSREFDSE